MKHKTTGVSQLAIVYPMGIGTGRVEAGLAWWEQQERGYLLCILARSGGCISRTKRPLGR